MRLILALMLGVSVGQALLPARAQAGVPVPHDIQRAIDLTNEWKLDEAERIATQSLVDAIACNDLLGRARALDVLGIVARSRGDNETALDFTTEALALAEDAKNADVLARIYNDLGRLLEGDRARDAYRRGLAMNPSDRVIVVRLFNNLGNLERDESDLAEAVRLYERARTLARKIGDRQGRLAAEHNIGLVYAQQNDPKRALEYLRRAQAIDPSSARTLLSISEAHRALGENDEALRVLVRARAAARDDLTRATILLREADLRASRGNFRGAERDLDASLKLDRASSALVLAYRAKLRLAQKRDRDAATLAMEAAASATDLDTITQAQSIAGVAHRRTGNLAGAKRAFLAAIAAIERERKLVAGNRESRQRFFEREVFPYVAMMEIAVDEGDAVRALEFAERAKARVLVDVLRTRAPAGLPSLNETVVEYAVAGSRMFAFIVTRERTRVVELERVDELANRFAKEIAERNLAFRKTARALYDAVIAPLALDVTRVCFVPDGELWRVPFQALMDASDRYLIERMSIFYAPSIAALREMSRRGMKRGETLLAAGNLAEADAELYTLRDLYGVNRTTLQTRASEEVVKREAPRHDVLHFAAHGVFDDASPLESYLALTDGRLTAREMMSLRLDASLVVLSACETAVGRQAAGEGLIGMSWALSIAGCPTMLASQWDVESASTTRLMLAFHRAYVGGVAPAEALRNAQLALLRTPRYEHPFYWAAFVVLGKGYGYGVRQRQLPLYFRAAPAAPFVNTKDGSFAAIESGNWRCRTPHESSRKSTATCASACTPAAASLPQSRAATCVAALHT